MRKLHEWPIRDKISTNEALRTIFHPTLALYLCKSELKDIKYLRIEVEHHEKSDTEFEGSKIKFYEA